MRFIFLLLLPLVAFADHVPQAGTMVPIPLMVCDTRDALDYVWSVHEDAGEQGGSAAMNLMTETPSPINEGSRLCGVMNGPWVLGETVRRGWLGFGSKEVWMVVTKVKSLRDGREYFAMLKADNEFRTRM